MVIARVRPSLYLCGLALVWGVVAAFMALTKNWQQLAGVRFVLGIVESGFAPGIAFYLSSWYVLNPRLLDLLLRGVSSF